MTSRGRGRGWGRGGAGGRMPRPGASYSPSDQMSKLQIVDPASIQPIGWILPPKTEPGQAGKPVTLETNMWELKLKPDTPLYRYEVSIKAVTLQGRSRELAGGGKNDFFYRQNREICSHVFYNLVTKNETDFENYFAFQYDLAKILYCLHSLKNVKEMYKVRLSDEDRRDLYIDENVTHYEVRVNRVDPDFDLALGQFEAAIDGDLRKRDRSSVQHLEISTSQIIYYNLAYWSFGNTHFPEDSALRDSALGRDREMIQGIAKNARVIEPTIKGGKPRAVMQMDVKTGVFWIEQQLIDLAFVLLKIDLGVRQNFRLSFGEKQRDHLSHIFRNLVVRTTYGKPRQITVVGVTHHGAADIKFPDDKGNEISVVQYILARYGVKIRYPNLPCVKEYRPRDKGHNYYPIECLLLLKGQRVTITKQSDAQMKFVVPKSALKPSDRWPKIDELSLEAEIPNNRFLKQLEITFSKEQLSTKGREIRPPSIQCSTKKGDVKELRVTAKCDWTLDRNCKYFKAGSVHNWAVMLVKNRNGSSPLSDAEYEEFMKIYLAEARNRGLDLPDPEFCDTAMAEGIKKFGDDSKAEGIKFILFITQRSGDKEVHDTVKEYFEETLDILSQHLACDRTVWKIARRDWGYEKVLENIVFKTNIKLGGLNYDINLPAIKKEGRIIVSYDVSHPTNIPVHMVDQIPSTVGLCSNSGKHPLQLTGNYGYQKMRKEECGNILKHVMISQLNIWHQNGKTAPTELLVLRDGISEGQYLKVITSEVPLLLSAFEELGLSIPKLEVYTVEKRHNARFKPATLNPRDKPSFQNVRPGTVVDSGVVHANQDEFYMCTHVAIQGTAKLPRYGKLVCEIGLSKDEIQKIIFGLACNHQIISAPVSLPATLYGAHELAKRGKNSRKAKLGRDESSSGVSTVGFRREASAEAQDTDFELGIRGMLQNYKFWA